MASKICTNDWLVIGGGLLGSSIVNSIKKAFPDEKIVWANRTKSDTASSDINKIVRTAYVDHRYKDLASTAMDIWKSDFRDLYHPVGWVQTLSDDGGRSTKRTADVQFLPHELQDTLATEIPPKLEPGEKLWLNTEVGSIDLARAVKALSDRAVHLGVVTLPENVKRMIVDTENTCRGVEMESGQEIFAHRTVLSAGVWSPSLLDQSNILYRQNFFTTVGVVAATIELSAAEFDKLQSMPILVTDMGEIMMSKHHKVLKVTTTKTFLVDHPDNVHTGASSTEPNRDVLAKMMPELRDRKMESWVCMDLMTPDQRPIIDQAEHTANLWLATGGNYHCAKFVNFGDLVVRRICNKSGQATPDAVIDQVLQGCGWERVLGLPPVHPEVVPSA